jgi:hypothetical protein
MGGAIPLSPPLPLAFMASYWENFAFFTSLTGIKGCCSIMENYEYRGTDYEL